MRSLFGSVVIGVLLMGFQPVPAPAQTIMSAEQAGQLVAIHNLTVKDDVVSGELVNNSSHVVRDVQLLIHSIWYWNNERRPGENPPGRADYFTVGEEIPAGGTSRFAYTVPSQPVPRADGHFETEVSVAGFTQMKQQNERPTKDTGPA